MTECVIITRRAQKILKGTIQIEPTCSQRLHLKVIFILNIKKTKEKVEGRGYIEESYTHEEHLSYQGC